MSESSIGIPGIVAHADVVVLAVLLVLVTFSVVSWAIIAFKFGSIHKSAKESEEFLGYFFDADNVEKAFAKSEQYHTGALPAIFRAGYIAARGMEVKGGSSGMARDRVALVVKKEGNLQSKKLGHLVPFLATVGNTAPFIGLFGTVWGIMTSFHNIGLTQSASLATVAPGLSEALVATAVGLAAAIPAVMGYNYLTQQISSIERDIEEFSSDFVTAFLSNT